MSGLTAPQMQSRIWKPGEDITPRNRHAAERQQCPDPTGEIEGAANLLPLEKPENAASEQSKGRGRIK